MLIINSKPYPTGVYIDDPQYNWGRVKPMNNNLKWVERKYFQRQIEPQSAACGLPGLYSFRMFSFPPVSLEVINI